MLKAMRSTAKYIWIAIAATFVGGFLLYETSGLIGQSPVTVNSIVAEVNGEKIPYLTWENAAQRLETQQQQRGGRSLTLDEIQQIRDQAFEELVADALLQQEYARRGIRVTDEEIIAEAQSNPPAEVMQDPQLQTEGRFDIQKYRRLLSSPAARQQGALVGLEGYYRTEIPRQKLFEQLATDVYVTDDRLWTTWQDRYDSAQVSFVAFRADQVPDSSVKVTDAESESYFNAHKKEFERPGRATVSVVRIPRLITAADSAAVRDKLLALRREIVGGVKFEEVAKRESIDSVSAADGGKLPRGGKGRFVPAFEEAAYKLKVGELSQPVLTQFGYHLIRVDEHKGDTLAMRHILLKIAPSDSSLTLTDRRADSLSRIAAGQDKPQRFDSAAKLLGLPVRQAGVIEGEPLTLDGRYVPSVSAWAFGGARAGESSDLYDAEDGFYLARLDTLVPGGSPKLATVKEEVRRLVAREKKVASLLPAAQALATAAVRSSLEAEAKTRGLVVAKPAAFTRVGYVDGLGQLNEAVGAAFGLPVGAVSAPITTRDAVFVVRVDRRVNADRAAWEAQKKTQREALLQQLRQQRVRDYLDNMRKSAKVSDKRKEIQGQLRRQAAAS